MGCGFGEDTSHQRRDGLKGLALAPHVKFGIFTVKHTILRHIYYLGHQFYCTMHSDAFYAFLQGWDFLFLFFESYCLGPNKSNGRFWPRHIYYRVSPNIEIESKYTPTAKPDYIKCRPSSSVLNNQGPAPVHEVTGSAQIYWMTVPVVIYWKTGPSIDWPNPNILGTNEKSRLTTIFSSLSFLFSSHFSFFFFSLFLFVFPLFFIHNPTSPKGPQPTGKFPSVPVG